jgi:hypothetical protein
MTNTQRTLISTATLALAITPAFAAPGDFDPMKPARPSAGVLNDYLREKDAGMAAWDFGVSTRLRYEMRDQFGIPGKGGPGADFRGDAIDNNNNYFLYKIRPRIGYNSEWFSALVEGRHSGTESDERNRPGPNPEADEFDLHQAYVVVGNHKEFPVSLKIGRQEMIYGDERLIGAFLWNNIGRVFDAAKVRWQNPWFGVDVFGSRPVIPDNHNFNMSNDYEYFSGAYFNSKLIPHQTTEWYFLARNVSPKALSYTGVTQLPFSARDIYTFGIRVKSTPGELNGWDYNAEAIGQLGHFNDPAAPAGTDPSLEHQAFAFFAGGGYTFSDVKFSPRVGLEYNFGSGDSDPTDNKHETFDNLYPTNHKFYGSMDFVSLQNIHNIRVNSSAKFLPRLTVNADYHLFWLADTHDNFYTAGGGRRGGTAPTPGTGYGINPTYDDFVGSEIDLVTTYAINSQATLEAGYGHFFTGKYIEQSLSVPGTKDADWVYVSLNINF